MTTPARPPCRPITVLPLQRKQAPPIPDEVFREAHYTDGKPYEETAGGRHPDDEPDDRA